MGSESVIAGSDCGFGSFLGLDPVDLDFVWCRLAYMAEVARRTTARLW